MNSYYPASLFAQYSSENHHMTPNVGYSSGNYGLFASRFAEQMGYHNTSFSDHHQRVANTYPAHQNHETSIYGREHGNTNGRIPSFPLADEGCHRPFSSCNTTTDSAWNQTSHSPDSTNNSGSPYSSSLDAQNGNNSLIQKDMKESHSPEPTTPYYPWMGIVGKLQ